MICWMVLRIKICMIQYIDRFYCSPDILYTLAGKGIGAYRYSGKL